MLPLLSSDSEVQTVEVAAADGPCPALALVARVSQACDHMRGQRGGINDLWVDDRPDLSGIHLDSDSGMNPNDGFAAELGCGGLSKVICGMWSSGV